MRIKIDPNKSWLSIERITGAGAVRTLVIKRIILVLFPALVSFAVTSTSALFWHPRFLFADFAGHHWPVVQRSSDLSYVRTLKRRRHSGFRTYAVYESRIGSGQGSSRKRRAFASN